MPTSLQKRWVARCWKCDIELTEQDRFKANCPRCACDLSLDGTTETDALVDEEARKSWKAASELAKVYNNWKTGYVRLIKASVEANYSLLDDFIMEVIELSSFYVLRLIEEGILQRDGMNYIKRILNDAASEILVELEAIENTQRLAGRWDQGEQELKDYWLGRYPALQKVSIPQC